MLFTVLLFTVGITSYLLSLICFIPLLLEKNFYCVVSQFPMFCFCSSFVGIAKETQSRMMLIYLSLLFFNNRKLLENIQNLSFLNIILHTQQERSRRCLA